VSLYIRVPNEEDLKEPKRTSKFIKASDWIHPISPEKISTAKTPTSETFP